MIWQKIAKAQHHVQRQNVAHADDLRFGVVEARRGMGLLQGREQHLVGVFAGDCVRLHRRVQF